VVWLQLTFHEAPPASLRQERDMTMPGHVAAASLHMRCLQAAAAGLLLAGLLMLAVLPCEPAMTGMRAGTAYQLYVS
jgi:hypothetical protein